MSSNRPETAFISLLILVAIGCASGEASDAKRPGVEAGAAGKSADAGAGGEASAGEGGAESGASGASETIGGEATIGGAAVMGGSAGEPQGPPQVLELSGDITDVHDPQIVEEDGVYYLFSTGQGVQVRVSDDLRTWKLAKQVFAKKPAWITTTDPAQPNHLWAPEVAFFGGQFHLFYAASKFGSRDSCIGHATRKSLGDSSDWLDGGKPVMCSNSGSNFNAIDPHPVTDEQGNVWLGLGSFWSGLKLIALKEDGSRANNDIYALATRANTAVEAPYIVYREGFYYLFESVDSCCQGSASTYKTMVGRSPSITGPYVDSDGAALASGGGTLVLQGGERWRGPGHNAVLRTQGRDYNVYHSYDAENDGVPTLRIAELAWELNGWPTSAGP